MSIIPRKFSSNEEENKNLFREEFIKELSKTESFEAKVYSDSVGIPSL